MSLIAQTDNAGTARDVAQVYLRARRLGYKRIFQENSMRDRLLLLNWLSALSGRWQKETQWKNLRELTAHCPDIGLSAPESKCIAPAPAPLALAGMSYPQRVSEVQGDELELIYGRIKAKLKYIQSLDVSRVRILHRLGNRVAEVFPALADCKHIKSLLVGGALNCHATPDSSQQAKLKEICASSQAMSASEAKFIEWSQSSAVLRPTKVSKQIDDVASSYDLGRTPVRSDDASWNILQSELRELQTSGMMAELEEAISYNLTVCGGFETRVMQSAASTTGAGINHLVQIMCDTSAEVDSSFKTDSSHTLKQRLKAVHERYQDEVACLLHQSLEHRIIQQHVPVRYAGTGGVLSEMRLRHIDVMQRAASACNDNCPFEFKYLASSKGRQKLDSISKVKVEKIQFE